MGPDRKTGYGVFYSFEKMAVKVFYYFWCFWPLLLLVYKSSGAKASIWVTVNIPHVNLLIFTFRCLFMTSSLEIARFSARIFWTYISQKRSISTHGPFFYLLPHNVFYNDGPFFQTWFSKISEFTFSDFNETLLIL